MNEEKKSKDHWRLFRIDLSKRRLDVFDSFKGWPNAHEEAEKVLKTLVTDWLRC